MNVALFYPYGSLGCAWNVSEGIANTLRRCGHKVDEYPMHTMRVPGEITKFPSFERLNKDFDLILISSLEWVCPKLQMFYGKYEWSHVKTPKVAWYSETTGHPENFNYPALKPYADFHFYPNYSDSKEFGGHWLTFGFDKDVFFPGQCKKKGAAFVGHVYSKRAEFLQYPGNQVPVISNVATKMPIGNYQHSLPGKVSAKMYADLLRDLLIVVDLPSASNLITTRVTEGIACGSLVVTPLRRDPGLTLYPQGCGVYYYDAKRNTLKDVVDHLLKDPKAVEEMAAFGLEDVWLYDTLEKRLEQIFEVVNESSTGS